MTVVAQAVGRDSHQSRNINPDQPMKNVADLLRGVADPCGSNARPRRKKRNIMELPLFERAVLIIKKFETMHHPKPGPMLDTVIVSSRESHIAEAAN